MKSLIRFKGGSGGNFLKSLLLSSNKTLHVKNNGHFFDRPTFEIFLKYTVPFDVCEKYNIPYESQWYDLNQGLIEKIMNDLMAESSDEVLVMHLVFKKNFNPEKFFGLYELVDLYPSKDGFWITQALQFYKSAFIKVYKLPRQYRKDDYIRHYQIESHFNKYGWFPSYWGWILEGPTSDGLDDVKHFIEKYGNSSKWNDKLNDLYYTGREYIIQADKFVIDKECRIINDMFKTFNAKLKEDNKSRMEHYANQNISVLKELGLYQYVGKDIDSQKQIELLKDCFLPIYKQLVER